MPFMGQADEDVSPKYTLFDAGLFIGALVTGDPRHAEARALVEDARRGTFLTCTTTGILSIVPVVFTGPLTLAPT